MDGFSYGPKPSDPMTESVPQLLYFAAMVTMVAVGWFCTVLALPGTWMILATAAVYAWLTPDGARWDISMEVLGVLLGLALVGEVLETLWSAAGVKKQGGSRRGAVLAIVGSLIGAVVGTGAIPIPVVGTLAGACAGAMLGAILGESWKGRDIDHALRVGNAAAWGRLVGSLAKICVASIMVAVVLASALLR
jgi:uncharacterized protein YqgC (DUF456 family)